LDELADARRAVDAGDDGHVVARADPAVFPLVAVERAHLRRRIEVDRAYVDADFVAIGAQVSDAEVLGVYVIANGNVLRGEADALAVAGHRGPGPDGPTGYLVAGLDVLADLDPVGAVFQDGAGRQLGLGDGDVVLGAQDDRLLRERVCGHGKPPAATIPD